MKLSSSATRRLVIGIETPGQTTVMKASLQLCQNTAMAHPFHTLTLVTFRNVGADEGKRDGVESTGKHLVDVENKFARNRVLVRGEPKLQRTHRPVDGWPVQCGETCADPEGAFAKLGGSGGEDGRRAVVFLDEIL